LTAILILVFQFSESEILMQEAFLLLLRKDQVSVTVKKLNR